VSLFVPRDYQCGIRDFILSRRRVNVFAGMGVGKTGSTLAALDILFLFGEAHRVLVLAPRRVAQSTWPDEVRKWDNLRHLKIAAAIGTEAQRRAAVFSGAQIVTINYENVPWLIETMGDRWDFDVVVADESTRLKGLRVSEQTSKNGKTFLRGQGGVRARALAKIAHKGVRRWINLTGSPAPNGLQDLWGQCWFIDAGSRLGRSFTAFETRWFQNVFRGERLALEPLPFAQAQIEAQLKDISITIEAKDYFDLPPLIESEVTVQLDDRLKAAYRKLEKEFFVEFGDGTAIEAFNSAAKLQKCLQFASGAVYDENGAWMAVHDLKLDALESIIEDANGMPVLVAYQFRCEVERILSRFRGARLLDANPKTITEWNEGRIPLMLAHPKSAGHGLNLQYGSNILCDFSSGFNLEEDEQIIERIGPTRQAQAGLDRAVYRRRIVCADTLEALAVLPALRRKASVQDALRAAMKLRRGEELRQAA
jgi:SNF2 family DNA or RNA helicase